MNKSELVKSIATKSGLTAEQATQALNGLTETISETLAKGDEITLVGFGTFKEITQRQAKTGHQPTQTGETIKFLPKKPQFSKQTLLTNSKTH